METICTYLSSQGPHLQKKAKQSLYGDCPFGVPWKRPKRGYPQTRHTHLCHGHLTRTGLGLDKNQDLLPWNSIQVRDQTYSTNQHLLRDCKPENRPRVQRTTIRILGVRFFGSEAVFHPLRSTGLVLRGLGGGDAAAADPLPRRQLELRYGADDGKGPQRRLLGVLGFSVNLRPSSANLTDQLVLACQPMNLPSLGISDVRNWCVMFYDFQGPDKIQLSWIVVVC